MGRSEDPLCDQWNEKCIFQGFSELLFFLL